MELVREEQSKKIFNDGDTSYTMIDMGSYVGHMYRDWYETPPEVWILMQVDDGQSKVEGLVDSDGQYIRFIADLGSVRRVIQLNNGKVYDDSVVVGIDPFDGTMGPSYIATEKEPYSKDAETVEEYFSHDQEFLWKGTKFEGDIPGNDLFVDMIEKNVEINKLINENKKSKTI